MELSLMLFSPPEPEPLFVSRMDQSDPLSSYSRHGFHLDDADWQTVEHYFQGMKFESPEQREAIRNTATPEEARKLAEEHEQAVRKDWKKIQQTVMTRGIYIKCLTHPGVAQALLVTGSIKIVENSSYDYFWGCGRDGRGHNTFGQVLMAVRDKLREAQSEA